MEWAFTLGNNESKIVSVPDGTPPPMVGDILILEQDQMKCRKYIVKTRELHMNVNGNNRVNHAIFGWSFTLELVE